MNDYKLYHGTGQLLGVFATENSKNAAATVASLYECPPDRTQQPNDTGFSRSSIFGNFTKIYLEDFQKQFFDIDLREKTQ